MMTAPALDNQPVKPRRWLGVLLSLLVPGFGLVRAGRPLRGLAWFAGLQLFGVVNAALFVIQAVPTWAVVAAVLANFLFLVIMLVDSFRPGQLTWPLAIVFFVACIGVAALPSLAHLAATAYKVPTASMEPTLLGGSHGQADHIIVDRITYLISSPKRGDLVVFRTTGIMGIEGEDALFVKRLVGLPGERIEIRNDRIYADGKLLDENSGVPPIKYPSPAMSHLPELFSAGSYTIPQDSFFYVGDNPRNSFDSRYFGAVPRTNIVGKVSRIYYPLSRFGVPRWTEAPR